MSDLSKEIPWFGPQLGEPEQREVLKVLNSNYINDGQVVKELEKQIAGFLGIPYAVAVTSGTAAITLSLMALGIGQGDEVIVPDLTFIATANAVRLTGADVKLVDVEPERFTIDSEKVLAAIGPKTKAIIPVDVNGRGANYEALNLIAKQHNLFIVCDSAEALGSKYHGSYLGTFGDAGCFSFSANKTVSSGQGGMVVTKNEELYYRIRELKDQGRRFGGTGGDDNHPVLGFNFKYTNLQAAVALAQLQRLPERLNHFRQRDQWYLEALSDCPGIILPPLSNEAFEIRQWTDLLCEDRKTLEYALKENNIGYRPFWHPIHRQQSYSLPDEGFRNTIDISKKGLWLPSSFILNAEDVIKVVKVIRDAMHKSKAKLKLDSQFV